ncbi:translation initiation factor 2 [Plantactinospora solaniradicis]|uniref:Translation initiation factor 2 n=1 Tax=Plantactinospora solaniradicis TaxID=1723736 RepID=A0ABW1K1L0_9ACTN
MTTRSGDAADDAFWRRPPEPSAGTPEPAAGTPAQPPRRPEVHYPGPPASDTPPPGWRPPVHVQPPPPRPLPAQDLPGLDVAEDSARTLTYGIGLVGGAALLVVMCLLCSRLLF